MRERTIANNRLKGPNQRQPRGEVVERMVDEFVGRVFNGAAKPLLVHLVGDRKIRPEDLDEIEKLVQARKKKQSWRSSR